MNYEDIEEYVKYGKSFVEAQGDEIFWERIDGPSANNHNTNGQNFIAMWMSYIDPLSTMMTILPSSHYGSRRAVATRESLVIESDDTHFWFRSVYRVTRLPFYSSRNEQTVASVEGFAVAIKKFITDNLDENLGSDFRQIVGGDWRTQITGNIYLVMEGGGPLDGLSNNVRVVRNIRPVADQNYSLSSLNHQIHWRCPRKSVKVLMKPAANNAYNDLLEGNLLIAPTGARGYVRGYANLVNGESMRPYASFQDEQEVMDLAKQHTEAYHPYTGWIPDRLEPVGVEANNFGLIKLDQAPMPVFGSAIEDRWHNRILHFTGAVSLLTGGSRLRVTPGAYFVIPSDITLSDIDMIEYDRVIEEEILPTITLSSQSSRSEAITNRIGDLGGGTIKTSITGKVISNSKNGDSGFIPRPNKRKIR